MAKSVAIVAGSYHKDKVELMVEIVKSLSEEENRFKRTNWFWFTKKNTFSRFENS